MWTRKELKDKAKVSFRANYWKTVLVALFVVALSIWASAPSSAVGSGAGMDASVPPATSYAPDDVNIDVHDGKVTVDVGDEGDGAVHINLDHEDAEELEEMIDELSHDSGSVVASGLFVPGMMLVGLSMGLIVLIIVAIAMAMYAFIFNPLEVGCMRFFVRNLNQRAEVKEVAFAYDNNYIESVKTLFLRDLFIFLWCLLLIIPGIYKAYEYRMIPYLMADDPTMTKDRAFAESKRMMDGQKWNAFVLDLSFLGWNILSAMTLGILGVFYVGPYQAQTNAALYEKLRYGLPAPEPAAQQWQAAPYGSAPAQPMQQAPYGAAPYGYPAQTAQATQAAPFAAVTAQPVQTMQPMQTGQQAQVTQAAPYESATVQPAQADSVETTAPAGAQVATVPIIAPVTQPPVPPFAAVGYEPASELDDEAEEMANPVEPLATAVSEEVLSAEPLAAAEDEVASSEDTPVQAESESQNSPEA